MACLVILNSHYLTQREVRAEDINLIFRHKVWRRNMMYLSVCFGSSYNNFGPADDYCRIYVAD